MQTHSAITWPWPNHSWKPKFGLKTLYGGSSGPASQHIRYRSAERPQNRILAPDASRSREAVAELCVCSEPCPHWTQLQSLQPTVSPDFPSQLHPRVRFRPIPEAHVPLLNSGISKNARCCTRSRSVAEPAERASCSECACYRVLLSPVLSAGCCASIALAAGLIPIQLLPRRRSRIARLRSSFSRLSTSADVTTTP